MTKKQRIYKACISTALTAFLLNATVYTGYMTIAAIEASKDADMDAEQAEIQVELQSEKKSNLSDWELAPANYTMAKDQMLSTAIAVSGGYLTHGAIVSRIEELENIHYVGECTLTAYCCEPYAHICGTGTGITASGLIVQPGLVAVDPKIIPLGSTVIIGDNVYLAADTGGAIKGNKIDIAVETHDEALQFGKQTAKVWYISDQE